MDLAKELIIVALANVLEHADRNNAIISPAFFAIVEQLERHLFLDPSSSCPVLRNAPLFLRQSEADDLHSKQSSEVQRQAAKSRADVEDAHARPEQQLCGDTLLFVR